MGNMKLIIGLVLAVALAVTLVLACAENPENKIIDMKIRFVNATGGEITNITLKERIGTLDQAWICHALASGGRIEMGIRPVAENGNPSLDFLFSNGDTLHHNLILENGDKTVTFRMDAEGDVFADIVNGLA